MIVVKGKRPHLLEATRPPVVRAFFVFWCVIELPEQYRVVRWYQQIPRMEVDTMQRIRTTNITSFRLAPTDLAKLEDLARATRRTRSEVLRWLLDAAQVEQPAAIGIETRGEVRANERA
jgi:hypothetical protein